MNKSVFKLMPLCFPQNLQRKVCAVLFIPVESADISSLYDLVIPLIYFVKVYVITILCYNHAFPFKQQLLLLHISSIILY